MDQKSVNELIRPSNWWDVLPREGYKGLEMIDVGQDWYSVYRLDKRTFIIYEDGQFDENVSYLVMGDKRAALIDTGDNLADLRELVRKLTNLPVFVMNTHCHLDHIGGNYLFDEVWAFDHRVSRATSALGVGHEKAKEVIQPGSLRKPIPEPFCEDDYCIPPYRVTHWIKDGEDIELGNRRLKAIYSPGHAPDHLMFFEKESGYLWTGDIFYTGCVYTHLPWGDLDTFIRTYKERVVPLLDQVNILLPSHNDPCKNIKVLEEVVQLAEIAREGKGHYEAGSEGVRKYKGSCFSLVISEKQAKS